jgi:Prokaryotic Cytochrome C oxidase subunit IV
VSQLKATLNSRITYVWLILSGITVVSWLLGRTSHDGHRVVSNTPITVAVLVIGAIKARLIIREFMEVRRAPTWLQRFTDIWLVVFWGAVLVIYLA